MIKSSYQKLIITSVLSVASTWALAEPTVYGKANVSFQMSDDGTDSVTEVVNNASRLGVKGSQVIEGDLKAIYLFEFGLALDDGSESNGQTFSQRNIYVGLQGNFGTVKVGRIDTPLKVSQSKIDLFNDLEGDIKNLITVNDTRVNNVVTYSSPDAPVVGNIAYVSSEDGEIDNAISASVGYTNDSLYLALATDQGIKGEDTSAMRLVMQYTLGDWKVGGLVEEYDSGAEAEIGYVASAQYAMNKWVFKGQYGTSDIDEMGGQSFSLGADYKLAKPVKVYGFVTALESDEGTDETYVGAGIEYKF